MQSDPQLKADDDRRQAERIELDGRYRLRLDPGDGREPVDCAVLDFSVTGVRLELPEEMTLPDVVQVVIGTLAHNSKIVWRNGKVVGVDFIDEHHDIY